MFSLSYVCVFLYLFHTVCLQYKSVYLWSSVPIILAVLNWVIFAGRYFWGLCSTSQQLLKQHTFVFLMGGYLCLPSVMRVQLQSIDCLELHPHEMYLRIDTSVDCTSKSFEQFKVIDVIFIVVCLLVPLLWFFLLWQRLNPSSFHGQALTISRNNSITLLRSQQLADEGLSSFSFLFVPYRPYFYYLEVVEVLRRIAFIGLLPLLTTNNARRAAFGVFFSLCSSVFYREVEPFARTVNNVLVHVAQLVIFMTYAAALAIETDLSKGVSDTFMGCVLVVVNLIILTLAFFMGLYRHKREQRKERERWAWKRVLSSQEAHLVDRIMGTRRSDQELQESAPSGAASGCREFR